MREPKRSAVRRFGADRSGNFAVITALAMVPVLLSVGAAVDLGLFYRDRSAIQGALDAAALAAGKQFYTDPDPGKLAQYANDFFEANTGGLFRTKATMKYEGTAWTADRTRELKMSACFEYDPIFLPILKVQFDGLSGQDCATAQSVIAVGNTTVEVAMVLDTSGSMNDTPAGGGKSKIATLREQATKAVNSIFGSASVSDDKEPVRMAVVPFSGGVNVGKDYLDAFWMDPKGLSPIHHENFEWSKYTQTKDKLGVVAHPQRATVVSLTNPVPWPAPQYANAWIDGIDRTKFMTRQMIYKSLQEKSANWAYRGCVESRPYPYNLTDDAPSEAVPATLFVPYFAPDQSDNLGSGWINSYVKDIPPSTGDDNPSGRMRNVDKYFGSNRAAHRAASNNLLNTPSGMCDSPSLMPLSSNKADVLSKVGSLLASGATNVPQGVEWGWKTLSKNEPFAQGRAAGDEKNMKAMIVMTDGENTYYNDSNNGSANTAVSAFGSYGFTGVATPADLSRPSSGVPTYARLFDYKTGANTATTLANYTAAMDARMALICENAKNDGRIKLKTPRGVQLTDEKGGVTRDGILIYTIAFDIPASSKTRVDTLLRNCASYRMDDLKDTSKKYADKSKYFYSASNAKELEAAFSDIMASLSNLRIAR